MINASAQNRPVVVSCDFVINLAPIAVKNPFDVAVAIHDLGNQLINFGNFTLKSQVSPCSLMHLYLLFLLLFYLLFGFFFCDTQGNGIGSSGVVDFVYSNGQRICF
jgi:hypothetical protein